MLASVACKQIGSEPLEHCAACNPKRSLQCKHDEKFKFKSLQRRRHGLRILWLEIPLWQECKLKTQRHQLCRSRKLWEMLKRQDLTTWQPETTFEEMLQTIGDSLSNLASSDNGEDGKDKDENEEDTERSKQSEDDELSWVIGTISNTVQYQIQHCQHMWMKLDELTQPGWGDMATTSVREPPSTGLPNWKMLQLVNHKRKMMPPHLHRRHLVSQWTIFTAAPENCICCKWLLDQEAVI